MSSSAAPRLLSGPICCGVNTQSSRLTDVCPAVTQYIMFLFCCLYILPVQARSWRCRKVNAAAAAAERGEKQFSALTQAGLRAHGKPHIVEQRGETKATSSVYFQLRIYGHACFALKHVWPQGPRFRTADVDDSLRIEEVHFWHDALLICLLQDFRFYCIKPMRKRRFGSFSTPVLLEKAPSLFLSSMLHTSLSIFFKVSAVWTSLVDNFWINSM